MCLCVEIGVCVWAHVNTARARIRHGPTRGEKRRVMCVLNITTQIFEPVCNHDTI